jgi:hypothetical protein
MSCQSRSFAARSSGFWHGADAYGSPRFAYGLPHSSLAIVTFDASPFVAHVGCNCRSNRFGFGDLEQKRNNLSGGTAAN